MNQATTQDVLRGFTLIEFLVYFAVATALVVLLSTASIGMLRVSYKAGQLHELNYASTYILETLDRVAAGAYALQVPGSAATGSSATFSMYDTNLNPTVIELHEGVLYLTEGVREQYALHTAAVKTQIVFEEIMHDGEHQVVHTILEVAASTTSPLREMQATETFSSMLMLNQTL